MDGEEDRRSYEKACKKTRGHYTLNMDSSGSPSIEGIYLNDLFYSRGRIIKYSFKEDQFYMSWPGLGQFIPLPSLEKFEDEVDTDLSRREEMGYKPERNF